MSGAQRSRAEPGAGWLRPQMEDTLGLVEVGSVFVVPAAPPPWGGTDGIAYAQGVTTPDGRTLFLRSHGLPFNILPRPWLGQGIDGCYSIGQGRVDDFETLVVLAQSFRPHAAGSFARLAGDERWAEPALTMIHRVYDRECALLSGVLT